MVFRKNKTLKAEKAVRSGDNQVGLEMPVFQSTPMLASWMVLHQLCSELSEAERRVA